MNPAGLAGLGPCPDEGMRDSALQAITVSCLGAAECSLAA